MNAVQSEHPDLFLDGLSQVDLLVDLNDLNDRADGFPFSTFLSGTVYALFEGHLRLAALRTAVLFRGVFGG